MWHMSKNRHSGWEHRRRRQPEHHDGKRKGGASRWSRELRINESGEEEVGDELEIAIDGKKSIRRRRPKTAVCIRDRRRVDSDADAVRSRRELFDPDRRGIIGSTRAGCEWRGDCVTVAAAIGTLQRFAIRENGGATRVRSEAEGRQQVVAPMPGKLFEFW